MSGFWETTPLSQMNHAQWEALCDGCGKCCLQKLEDEDSGEVFYTAISCTLLDTDTCRCQDYPHRLARVPECLTLNPGKISELHWLPTTCAYRLLAEKKDLPEWHPLISGDPESVHRAGISVKGRVLSEEHVHEDEWQEHIVHWVDESEG